MKKIVDNNGATMLVLNDKDAMDAYEYLTIPSYKLAEQRGLKMKDFYELNRKYYQPIRGKGYELPYKIENL